MRHIFTVSLKISKSVARRFCDSFSLFLVEDFAVPLGRAMSEYRLRRGKGRTLWGITPIITLPMNAMADRLLGLTSDSVVFHTYSTTRSFDINLNRLLHAVLNMAPALYAPMHRLVLVWVLLRYDIIHVFADRGIMPSSQKIGIDPWEMDRFAAAAKRFYVYCYGADVRTRKKTLSLGRWNFCVDCPKPRELCICDDGAGAANLDSIEKRATAIVSLGDMLEYVPRPVHLAYWPVDVGGLPNVGAPQSSGRLKIAHAPNHPYFKGTKYLQAAIAALREAGHEIELVLVSEVSNARVLEIIAECDVVADQFIGGAYGYTALEGMARGKPVFTYVRSADLAEASDECPLINTTPDTLQEALLWALRNRARLPAIGAQGRVYVEKWHSLDAVAERLGGLYERTANLPKASLIGILAHREKWRRTREAISEAEGWRHPWQVTADTPR